MTRIHKGALVFVSVLLVLVLTGCDFFGFGYQVGDIGPGGGIIFYVDSSNNFAGWTYLEAAPKETEFTAQWGLSGIRVEPSARDGIGEGFRNTPRIVSSLGSHGTYAASLANRLTHNGFDDWYLPSYDELDLMYINLHTRGLGDFDNTNYWSSSTCSTCETTARGQSFSSGARFSSSTRTWNRRVRAIRRFM